MSEMQSDIKSIDTRLTRVEERLDKVETRLTAVEKDVSEMKVQIADLQEESKITRAAVNYNGQRLDDLYSVLKENHVIA